jgi:hypothetical protein
MTRHRGLLARFLRGTAAALALLSAVAASGAPLDAQSMPAVEAVHAEPKIQPELPPAPAAISKANLERAVHVALVPMTKARIAQEAEAGSSGAPLQVGFARAVPALSAAEEVARTLSWQPVTGGGSVAALTITSPGAVALRAGVLVEALPAAATLKFHAPGSGEVVAASAREVEATLARNAASGDATQAARTFWSPVVEGDTLAVEVEIPAGVAAGDVRIAVPAISHLVASSRDGFAKATASCEIDAMCHQDTWGVESSAVARIIFTDAGTSYVCTGTLLADRDSATFIPYFLTANHCVSSQTIASTVQAYWFWRASACNSGVRGASQTTFGGGTLLYASGNTDTSFMRLNAPPPAGAAFAGWIASEPSQGSAVTGIHNPGGDLQKISFGNVASFWNCAPTKDDQFSCNGSSASLATFLGVSWRTGLTEGGSSGSGLFTDNGRYLVGQLFGGSGKCSAPGTDYYGRFDLAYNAGLSQWLGTTSASNGATPAADYSDLWWNAAESGWGLSLTQHSGALFGAWFVYDAAGKPTWYVIPGGRWNTSTLFTGDVYAVTGPDPTASAFDPTRVVRTRVGSATLRFTSATQGNFSYTVNGVSESRDITRQPFGNGSAVTDGFGDLWWNASESGWGLSLHQHGDTLFAIWYSYAPDGSATWFVMPGGTWTAADTYNGTLYRTTAPGAFFGRAFDAAGVVRRDVGHVTLRFLNSGTALMTYSVDGVFGMKQITRQPF